MNTEMTDRSTDAAEKFPNEGYHPDGSGAPSSLSSVTGGMRDVGAPGDPSQAYQDDGMEYNICTCSYEKDMTPENRFLLRRLDAQIMRKSAEVLTEPRVSIITEVVEILSTAFVVDSPSGNFSLYRLQSWAKSMAMDGVLDSIENILISLKPLKIWSVHLDSLDGQLDTLSIFISIIIEMLRMKTYILQYENYENDYNELQEDITAHLNGVRNSNFQIGILTGKFTLSSLPKFAAVESVADFLPEDNVLEDCAVCKCIQLSPDINFGMLSNCRHVFCASCLRRTFESSSRCPVCRVESAYWLSRDQFLKLKSQTSHLQDGGKD